MPAEKQWDELEQYLDGVLTGRLVEGRSFYRWAWPASQATPYFVKFCRANRLLPWLARRWGHVKIIHLLRHPCAVVSSQLRHCGFRNMADRYVIDSGPYADEFYEPYRDLVESLSGPEEILAARWCLDDMPPLVDPRRDELWHTVRYEELVENVDRWDGVFRAVGHAMPDGLRDRVGKPSETTVGGSPILEGGDQRTGWQRHLSAQQIERIGRIVSEFGMDHVYGKAPVQPQGEPV